MKITTAKTAGFCFGVKRRVDMTESLAREGKKIATLGPLIHNNQVVDMLEGLGVLTLNSNDVPPGYEVVLRSHGVVKSVYDEFADKNIVFHDATCPNVKRIHALAKQAGDEGRILVVAGDENHPEVQGIVSYTTGEVHVFDDISELENWLCVAKNCEKPLTFVAQTTFMLKKWSDIVSRVKNLCTDFKIFDTICRATGERQKEAEQLSKECDMMVVIGGHHSSNTQKLVEVCRQNCRTISIETVKELSREFFIDIQNVGVTAGASTPTFIIQEVLNNMSEEIREEGKSFEELLNESYANQPKIYRNATVKGIVKGISGNEVTVDIGTKQTGFIKSDELSDDPNAKITDLVKEGDELNLIVIKVSDLDGTIELSKKRYDARQGDDLVAKAAETGETVEASVKEVVKGGLVAYVSNVRVFIPASLAATKIDALETLVGTKQNIKIVESTKDGNRRKVIGSIKAAKDEVAKELKEKFWETAEVGQVIEGTVKSITKYGAFVDLGGVDGLVHLSELTWEKIRHPSEMLKVGDKIEVFIKNLDAETGKISLGHKKEEDNPWMILENDYPIGTVFTAKVASITKFGAFVKVLPGIDGLVHISEVSYEKVEDLNTVLKVGQEVDVKLIGVDFENKRVSLSIKQTKEPPVKAAEEEKAAEE